MTSTWYLHDKANPEPIPEPESPESPDGSTVKASFTLKFKATGIQSTSFKDYKEAMTALNGLSI